MELLFSIVLHGVAAFFAAFNRSIADELIARLVVSIQLVFVTRLLGFQESKQARILFAQAGDAGLGQQVHEKPRYAGAFYDSSSDALDNKT